jgi:hypothetical protein
MYTLRKPNMMTALSIVYTVFSHFGNATVASNPSQDKAACLNSFC